MSKNNNTTETLYEKIVRSLKNRKSIVFIILAFTIVIAVASFLKSIVDITKIFKPKAKKIQAIIYVQPFDILSEAIDPPHSLPYMYGDIERSEDLAKSIVENITKLIQPQRKLEVQLKLSSDFLISSRDLYVYIFLGIGLQAGPLREKLDKNTNLNLNDFYDNIRNSSFFSDVPLKSHKTIYIGDREKNFRFLA